MIDRRLIALVALPVSLQACSESKGSSAHDAGHVRTAMTMIATPERDAGMAGLDAMVDGSTPSPTDASVATPDAAVDAAARPAADGGREHAPTSGHAAAGGAGKHAAVGGTGGVGGQVDAAAGQSGGSAGATAPEEDPKTFAAELSGLFIDMPCDPATPTPLPEGMACSHAPNSQSFEKTVTFGGKAGTHYTLTLRVRGIVEQTDITGGVDPYPGIPFTVGGMVAQNPDGTSTNAINYQQFQIQVSEPMQTYWLNNYHGTTHEIHKEDYEASFEVAGGSQIKLVVHDGNELEISNFRQFLFTEFPPYDKAPSLGQSVRFDVVTVEARP